MTSHQYQPTDTSCGQTCIAMLLGVRAETVIAGLPGGKNGTTAKQLAAYLNARGYRVSPRLKRHKNGAAFPRVAILRWKWPRRRVGHWLLVVDGLLYDPGRWPRVGGRVTSYIEIVA